MTTLAELAGLSNRPLSIERDPAGDPVTNYGTFSDYVRLGGERIWVRVYRGWIIKAEAPPDFGQPNVNRKWIAEQGMVGLEAGAMLRRAAGE